MSGSCVNCGYTLTKTLLALAKLAHQIRRSPNYDVDAGQLATQPLKETIFSFPR